VEQVYGANFLHVIWTTLSSMTTPVLILQELQETFFNHGLLLVRTEIR